MTFHSQKSPFRIVVIKTSYFTVLFIYTLTYFNIKREAIEVFDSLGVNEEKLNNIKQYFKFRGIKTLEYNESKFQSETSESCGLFVIYFLIERLYNLDLTFDDILEDIFDINSALNEDKVIRFCENILLDKET